MTTCGAQSQSHPHVSKNSLAFETSQDDPVGVPHALIH